MILRKLFIYIKVICIFNNLKKNLVRFDFHNGNIKYELKLIIFFVYHLTPQNLWGRITK